MALPTIKAVWEKHNGICAICGDSVDLSLRHPNPFSASRDHIIPIMGSGRRGANDPSNIQLAHLRCNIRKSNYSNENARRVNAARRTQVRQIMFKLEPHITQQLEIHERYRHKNDIVSQALLEYFQRHRPDEPLTPAVDMLSCDHGLPAIQQREEAAGPSAPR